MIVNALMQFMFVTPLLMSKHPVVVHCEMDRYLYVCHDMTMLYAFVWWRFDDQISSSQALEKRDCQFLYIYINLILFVYVYTHRIFTNFFYQFLYRCYKSHNTPSKNSVSTLWSNLKCMTGGVFFSWIVFIKTLPRYLYNKGRCITQIWLNKCQNYWAFFLLNIAVFP